MNTKGSVFFVTGANRGLGLAFANEALARGAAKVYAGVRSLDGFDRTDLVPVRIDVTDPNSIATAAREASDVTVLVNNAGIAELTDGPLAGDMESKSRRLLETNYYGVMRVTQAFQGALPNDGRGAIINVLSDATWRAATALAPYAVSKAAVWSYTNHIRLELRQRNIQVLGLHVGFVDTDLTRGLDVPKSSVTDVVRQTLDALEAGQTEIMADQGTLALKRSLSSETPGYLL